MAKYENPLIPNARMREIYTAMVETRILAKHTRKQFPGFAPSLEAVWVATVVDLHEGDLTSDAGIGPLLAYARDAQRQRASALASVLNGKAGPGRLPAIGTVADRLWCAIGASLALRANGGKGVLLAYATQDDLKPAEWTRLLTAASEADAPLLFVILPGADEPTFNLATLATKAGVPGIPVDASDSVAIYRVTQESLVRARADSRPALLSAIPFPAGSKPADPIALLAKQMVAKQVTTPAWLAAVEPKFRTRLEAAVLKARGLH
jgi:TPP-dependent pyruvate/acetoin dehydrogenase alpha subunit